MDQKDRTLMDAANMLREAAQECARRAEWYLANQDRSAAWAMQDKAASYKRQAIRCEAAAR